MNFDHATATNAETTNHDASLAATSPITGWHALNGLPIGVLRGLSPGTDLEIAIGSVAEHCLDLAVADRVAWVLAQRTGESHVVLESSHGYVVATVGPQLDWAAAMRLQRYAHAPVIISVANMEGVLPVPTLMAV